MPFGNTYYNPLKSKEMQPLLIAANRLIRNKLFAHSGCSALEPIQAAFFSARFSLTSSSISRLSGSTWLPSFMIDIPVRIEAKSTARSASGMMKNQNMLFYAAYFVLRIGHNATEQPDTDPKVME
jgi:hypothetical protein